MHDHFCRMLCLKRIMHMLAFGCSDERGRRRWYMGRLTTEHTVCMLWLSVRSMAAILLRM